MTGSGSGCFARIQTFVVSHISRKTGAVWGAREFSGRVRKRLYLPGLAAARKGWIRFGLRQHHRS